MRLGSIVIGWAFVGVVAGSARGQDSLTQARALYDSNRLDQAYPLFQRAAAQHAGNAEIHAWLAETARRTGRYDEARVAARTAVGLDSCHAFALGVLATLYQPIYSGWPDADADSAWTYYRRAVTCDPADGNAWIGLWMEALRRGDHSLEEQALRTLGTSGFLTGPVMAYNRWVLRALPPRALLLASGDWDTYPALAAQLVEGLRPDVGVVNLSLLNLPWYVRLVSDRYQLAPPLDSAEMERLVEAGGLSDAVVEAWRSRTLDGGMERPLAAAATSTPFTEGGGPGVLRDAGPYGLVVSGTTAAPDTAAMRRALDDLRGAELAGPEVSPADRSSVRVNAAGQRPLATNALWAGLRYAAALIEAGSAVEAALAWADAFVRDAQLGASQREMVETVREEARRVRDNR
jgi:tetratricopeptide (TPR) repeat protein